MVEIYDKTSWEDVRMVGTVHDAILFNIRNNILYEKVKEVKNIMEHPRLLDKFNINLDIPLIADVEIGDWGIGEEWTSNNH